MHCIQARGERAVIRSQILLDPLVNPHVDVKTRMCKEYLKSMGVRHAEAMKQYDWCLKLIAEQRSTKVGW